MITETSKQELVGHLAAWIGGAAVAAAALFFMIGMKRIVSFSDLGPAAPLTAAAALLAFGVTIWALAAIIFLLAKSVRAKR